MQRYCFSSPIPQDNEVSVLPYSSLRMCSLFSLLEEAKGWGAPAVGHNQHNHPEPQKLLLHAQERAGARLSPSFYVWSRYASTVGVGHDEVWMKDEWREAGRSHPCC